ncbi:hypothetical protein [Tenacibaculum piscium]|uniref:hypothetical protein n=1 Tax=Tenacibaculum piscium TaxID=1458515 RepID=UPI00187BA743|nr:hypothetical protein [Tenacibaculum piscium]MBE7685495.1 hypothetical protein [Tenacibaculum piscium]MBE7690078.1 hypothetical protein [Tenacibaculum piscium]
MDKQKLISRNNKESLGKYFLKKSVDFAIENSFSKSYEFIKEGLDILTCDCGSWRRKFEKLDKDIFEDLIINTDEKLEYYFVKGYFLCFKENKKELYLGLDAIEKYLKEKIDEYGLYVKGKILIGLGEYNEALSTFSEAIKFGKNSRLLYRIGRTKEKYFNLHGLEDLYESFNINPSSVCCTRVLKKYTNERKIELLPFKFNDEEQNELFISFIDSDDEWEFDNLYEKYLSYEFLDNDLTKETMPTIISFIQMLQINKSVFIEEIDEFDEFEFKNYNYDNYNDDYTRPDDSPYYNDGLDMDQQSPEFWDSL